MVLVKEKPEKRYWWKWMILLQALSIGAQAQDVIRNESGSQAKLLETHPTAVQVTAGTSMNASFRAEGKAFFFRLSGTGTTAHTINTDDPVIFLFANDSTATLRSPSVQGYNDLDSFRTFSHEYTLLQEDLEMISRNKVRALRKYSVMGYDEFYLDETASANLQLQSQYFMQVLDKENLLKKVVITEPAFPGGKDVLLSFINTNLKQLPILRRGEQKTATVQFQVWPDGSIQQMQISQSAGTVFDNELLRILKRMPRWKPALADGDLIQRSVIQQVKFYQEADKVKVIF
jgi:TonB family protein